jgi:hypothetical protein
MITDEEIFDIIDGLANENLLAKHKELIEVSQEYKIRFKEFEKMESMLSSLKIELPSSEFTNNLMEKIALAHQPVYTKKLLKVPFYFLGFLIFLVGLIVFVALKYNSNMDSNYDFSFGINPKNFIIFKQILLIINGLIFLLVMDKWILKKYFQTRFS